MQGLAVLILLGVFSTAAAQPAGRPFRSHSTHGAAQKVARLTCALLLALLCGAAAAASDPPAPRPWHGASHQQRAGSDEEQYSARHDPEPASSAAFEADRPASIDQHKAQDPAKQDKGYTSPEWWVVGATIVLDLVTLGLAVYTACLYRATVALGKDAKGTSERQAVEHQRVFALANPPRIRITNIAIWKAEEPKEPPGQLTPGLRIAGWAHAVNIGADDAKLDEVEPNFAKMYFVRGSLPMIRPYQGQQFTDDDAFKVERPRMSGHWEQAKVLKPGEYGRWLFCDTVPLEFDDEFSLYVMGHVFYRTAVGTRRGTLFCRRFDQERQTFVRVDRHYTDYEDEE